MGNYGFRQLDFQRNENLERLLKELGNDLRPAEQKLVERYRGRSFDYPVILVVGALRSGTTLLMQWLANTGLVFYPSNVLSRFYEAPILGAKIQMLLTDPRFNFRDELGEFPRSVDYDSNNGKTRGALSPNEFWYFWRRFLSEPERDVWSDEELLRTMDALTLKAELVGVMDVAGKPFAAKALLFNYNIRALNRLFEKALFVYVKRDPITNIASILKARKRQFGNPNKWYSFEIPEYEDLKDNEPFSQCAGQFYYINKAVTEGIASVDDKRKLMVQYEDFCEDPASVYRLFSARLNEMGYATWSEYSGVPRFTPSGHEKLDVRTIKKIDAAYQEFL